MSKPTYEELERGLKLVRRERDQLARHYATLRKDCDRALADLRARFDEALADKAAALEALADADREAEAAARESGWLSRRLDAVLGERVA